MTITIYGLVQGVGFRYFVKQKAHDYGVYGWVANQPDGSLRVEAESEEDVLEEFLAACSEGPLPASVEKVDYDCGEVQNYDSFEIR